MEKQRVTDPVVVTLVAGLIPAVAGAAGAAPAPRARRTAGPAGSSRRRCATGSR